MEKDIGLTLIPNKLVCKFGENLYIVLICILKINRD
jgi:hypothetical protein